MATLSLIVAVACVVAAYAYWRYQTQKDDTPSLTPRRRDSDRPRSYPPSSSRAPRSKLGLSVPPGRFTRGLADPDRDTFQAAVANISALAVAGDPSGLEELEELIGANTDRGFHDFGRGFKSRDADLDPHGELLALARRGSLFSDVPKALASVPPLAKHGAVSGTVRDLRRECGERNARELELLYAQLSIRSKYRREGLRGLR